LPAGVAVIVHQVAFAVQMVVASQKNIQVVLFHFAQQDCQGHLLAGGAAPVPVQDAGMAPVQDAGMHPQPPNLFTQSRKVRWSFL